MAPSQSQNFMRTTLYALVAIIVFSFACINHANAFQNKPVDTVSSSDVQFKDITTSASDAKKK